MQRKASQSTCWNRCFSRGISYCLLISWKVLSVVCWQYIQILGEPESICPPPPQCYDGSLIIKEGSPVGTLIINITRKERWDFDFNSMDTAHAKVLAGIVTSTLKEDCFAVEVSKPFNVEDIYEKSNGTVDLGAIPIEMQVWCNYEGMWRKAYKCVLMLKGENNYNPVFQAEAVLRIKEDADARKPVAVLDGLYEDADRPSDREQGFGLAPFIIRLGQPSNPGQLPSGTIEDLTCRSGHGIFRVTPTGDIYINSALATRRLDDVYCLNITSETVDHQKSWAAVTLLVEPVNQNSRRFAKRVLNAIVNVKENIPESEGTWAIDGDVNSMFFEDIKELELDIVTGSVPDYRNYYSLKRKGATPYQYVFELNVEQFKHLKGFFLFLVLRARQVHFSHSTTPDCALVSDFVFIRVIKEEMDCPAKMAAAKGGQPAVGDNSSSVFIGIVGALCICSIALVGFILLNRQDSVSSRFPPATPPSSTKSMESATDSIDTESLMQSLKQLQDRAQKQSKEEKVAEKQNKEEKGQDKK